MGRKWIEKRRRGVFGWIFMLLFWGWQALMVWALFTGVAATECNQFAAGSAEHDGCMAGTGLGALVVMMMWAVGSVVFGMLAFFTRGKREMIEVET